VRIRFLLGPAGSGKTHRCLTEIRAALQENSEGPPLILLAPKQSTFQLERQLLADGALSGYTRLHILSFERLAEFVFEGLGKPVPRLLAEEGRVMVLRALLQQQRAELEIFRSSARLPGFALHLSKLLRELQQNHLSPLRLEELARQVNDSGRLNAKLRDLALILRAYSDWLKAHALEDADQFLDQASAALKAKSQDPGSKFQISQLWLDGFAQMTPQERRLLAAIIPHAEQATLAFCLDAEPDQRPPWHSSWAPVTEAFLRCRDELSGLPGAEIEVEAIPRDPTRSRFDAQPMLRHLERWWGKTTGLPATDPAEHGVRLVSCPNPEAEVECVAHEIRRYVREDKGRFRDVAVLLRSLDGYHDSIRRIFTRYEIPFFLDRRESVAHHPLAELTRNALRVLTYGWEHDDWFGALKTGLVTDDDTMIDRFENEALARGWRGELFWSQPIQMSGASEIVQQQFEQFRQRVVPPFQKFSESLADRRPSGGQLATAVQELWANLKVNKKLERWGSAANADPTMPNPALHETVWDQMAEWLKNIELAFATETLPLNEWLPVVEAGLGNLSVGVIPPALDQVLIGAIDRSRNPDLQVVFLLGVNEGVFPAPPPAPILLNRADRDFLASHNAALGPDYLHQIGLERYYGYIACTRARKRVMLTYAHSDNRGRELNPSVFIGDLQRLFPALPVEVFSGLPDWRVTEHWSELMVPLLQSAKLTRQFRLHPGVSQVENVLVRCERANGLSTEEKLAPELVDRLYGTELRTSVSGLEDFAACPFRFFVGRGLRAEERVEFEIDPREKGSFQHEVLKEFHGRIQKAGKRWRDISPEQARTMIRQIGEELLPQFREGLFMAAPARRFTGQMLIEGLERLVETLILWTRQYDFDPAAVEIGFGLKESRLPAWRIDLDDQHALLLRGRIDRVDICRIEQTGEALAVVIDYKSSARLLDSVLLHHGLELQLLAYLGALSQFKSFEGELDVSRLIPAGAFYIALKGGDGSASTREEERSGREQARRSGSQHRGRFDGEHLRKFDQSGANKGDQFQFALKQDGSFASRGNEALLAEDFRALVTKVQEFLRQHGREVYAGKISIAPFRWKKATACDFCDYRPICRFDPWTQLYRVLRPPTK
jgi:ATP-dependent helicase/nuclease subunit B